MKTRLWTSRTLLVQPWKTPSARSESQRSQPPARQQTKIRTLMSLWPNEGFTQIPPKLVTPNDSCRWVLPMARYLTSWRRGERHTPSLSLVSSRVVWNQIYTPRPRRGFLRQQTECGRGALRAIMNVERPRTTHSNRRLSLLSGTVLQEKVGQSQMTRAPEWARF